MSEHYRIGSITLFTENLRTRIPFRYGIATMTELPHCFLQIEVVNGGRSARGLAADHLPPKWFTKDPQAAIPDEIATMQEVIIHAASLVRGRSFQSVFELWRDVSSGQKAWAEAKGYPALLANFGTSLVERAVMAAYCRLHDITFAEAIRRNCFEIDLRAIDSSMPADWQQLLPAHPLAHVSARHTVGLLDEIFEADIDRPERRVNDGLPQTLEAAVQTYQLREFKIKFGGKWAEDESRLARIFECLNQTAPSDWRFSLDGNESFSDASSFREYWSKLSTLEWFRPELRRLIFIEQPLHRAVALSDRADWRDWPEAPVMTIDESDGDFGDVPRSLALGYSGSTHKNCKGIIKGILNRCRLTLAAQQTGRKILMTGEDLSNIGPVALTQDLVVQAVLGNSSVERNGHHYFRGLTMWPDAVQAEMLQAHPDLYGQKDDLCALKIQDGRISTDSILRAPFGYMPDLDPATFCTSARQLA